MKGPTTTLVPLDQRASWARKETEFDADDFWAKLKQQLDVIANEETEVVDDPDEPGVYEDAGIEPDCHETLGISYGLFV